MTGRGEPPLLGFGDSGRLNAYVLWSLWYEWLFYLLIMPVCAVMVDLLRGRLPAITVPIALLVIGLVAWTFDLKPKLLGFLPFFAASMIAYECQLREHIRRLLRSRAATVCALLSLGFAVNIAAFPYSFAVLLLLGLFFTCVACGNALGGVLRTPGALVLGEISFGIYLLHGFVLWSLFTAFGRLALPLIFPLAAVVTVPIAALAHLLVERPGIRIGAMMAKSWSVLSALRPALQGAP